MKIELTFGLEKLKCSIFDSSDSSCLAMNEKESFLEVHLDVRHSVLGSDMTLNISNTNRMSIFYGQIA